MEIVLVGLNHRTAPVEMRERVAFNAEQARRAAEGLRSGAILEETLVLSTCNRSEIYGVPPEAAPNTLGEMESFLASFHEISPADLNGCLYRYRNREAAQHLFRVAAGLDSMLLGEAEILGQVREAYRIALEHGTTGPVLNRLFQAALEIGKRVRTETDLGTHPMSVAFAGVKLAEKIFGNLRGHTAFVLGAGAMGEQVVEHIRGRGITRILVANRSRAHGEELARRVGGEVVAWEALARTLEVPNMIVSSVGSAEPVLTRPMLEQAMAARGNRTLFIIDLGVPRNVESAVGDLYNIFLYNVDDLAEIVEQNKKAREQEIPRAEALINEQLGKFEGWQASVHAVTLLNELRAKLHRKRSEFLRDRLDQMPQLSPDDRERVARLTEELLEHVLLEPAERLRTGRELRRKLQSVEALLDLFGLDKEK